MCIGFPLEIDVKRRTLPVLLAAAALTVSACSFADEVRAQPTPSPTTTEQPSVAPSPRTREDALVLAWTGTFDVSLPNGWDVRSCEGDRLDACVYAGDDRLGGFELLNGYPLGDSQLSQDAETVLSDLAAGFLEHFRQDRSVGCSEFVFVDDPVADVSVGGQPGKRAAFSLRDGNGRVVERVVNYFALQGDTYAIANAAAYVPDGGCLGLSEYDPYFAPADLDTLEQYLDEVIANSPLPETPA